MKEKTFVTKYGVFACIVVTVISVSIFSYPGELSTLIGSDGWIVTLIGGIISYLLLYLIYIVVKKNNYDSLINILENNLGKFLSKIFALIFTTLNILSIAITLRIFTEVIKMYLLQKTPTEVILITMIITATYLIRSGTDTLVKFNEIAFWIMFIPIIFIIVATLNHVDFTNILPVLNNKPLNYIKAIKISVLSFEGLQIAYFIIPFAKDPSKISKVLFKSVLFITLFYTVITILCLAVFDVKETSNLLWPTLSMVSSIDIPGSFIERWEGIVMALWVVFYFTTLVNIYYFSSQTVKNVFKLNDVKLSSLIILPFIYIIALYPDNIGEVYSFSNFILTLLFAFNLLIMPLILLLMTTIRKRSGKDGV